MARSDSLNKPTIHLVNQAKDLIAEGEIHDALKLLRCDLLEDYEDDILSLKHRYNKLQQEKNLYIISRADEKVDLGRGLVRLTRYGRFDGAQPGNLLLGPHHVAAKGLAAFPCAVR